MFLLLLFTPATLPILMTGQITLLWMAGLLAAIAALRQERWVLAGIFIGLLTLKPTLGLLIPAALLAITAFRTIISAAITTVVVQGGATLVFGMDYWHAWRAAAAEQSDFVLFQMPIFDHFASISAFISRFGVPVETAWAINFALAPILMLIVFLVWRKLGVRSDAAVAVLFAAIPIATPYLWLYDAAFVVIAMMFMLRALDGRIQLWHGVLFVAFWIGPGIITWNSFFLKQDWIGAIWILPPLLTIALVMSLSIAMRSQTSHPS